MKKDINVKYTGLSNVEASDLLTLVKDFCLPEFIYNDLHDTFYETRCDENGEVLKTKSGKIRYFIRPNLNQYGYYHKLIKASIKNQLDNEYQSVSARNLLYLHNKQRMKDGKQPVHYYTEA